MATASARPAKEQVLRAHADEGTAPGRRLRSLTVLVLAAAAVVLMAVGLLLALVGALGWRGRLRRNRFAGVRTAVTMSSEDAFRVGNRVAGPVVLAAGAVSLLGGVAALVVPSAVAGWTVLAVTTVGAFGLTVAGGVLGSAAAPGSAPVQPARPVGCASCVCGTPGSRGCLAASAAEDKGR
jgi:nitrate reductase NapE component